MIKKVTAKTVECHDECITVPMKVTNIFPHGECFVPNICGNKRPPRKVMCQRPKGHKGSCQAVIFWEKEHEHGTTDKRPMD